MEAAPCPPGRANDYGEAFKQVLVPVYRDPEKARAEFEQSGTQRAPTAPRNCSATSGSSGSLAR
jgi:hypothetical protein